MMLEFSSQERFQKSQQNRFQRRLLSLKIENVSALDCFLFLFCKIRNQILWISIVLQAIERIANIVQQYKSHVLDANKTRLVSYRFAFVAPFPQPYRYGEICFPEVWWNRHSLNTSVSRNYSTITPLKLISGSSERRRCPAWCQS